MVDVPWPLSNNPGLRPQEGTGRLINVFAEPRGDGTPVWRRVPGALVFARAPSVGEAELSFNANAAGAQDAAPGSAVLELVASAVGAADVVDALGSASLDFVATAVGST